MYDDQNSEGGPKGTYETYKAEGDNLYKQGEYRKAIESYNTALELKPTDRNCLVSRSKCYLQLGETQKAYEDAEASLVDDKDFHKGLFQKAEALYSMGNFEMALVFYHRGHKLRPELQEFRLGIQKAQEAIDNSVGSPAKVKLTKEGDLSFFAKQDEKKSKKPTFGYAKPAVQKQQAAKREPKGASGSEKTEKQLLGELYGDKQFLEKLLKEYDSNTQRGKEINNLVINCLDYLSDRREFWRQQKPIYARQSEKRKVMGGAVGQSKSNYNQYIIKELEKIDEAQANGRFEESLRMSNKCLKTVEGWSDDAVSNRHEVLANLYSSMGNAYLEMAQFEKSLQYHQKDLDIANKHDTEHLKSRALDNLGRVYARSGKFQDAVNVWTEKLPMSKSALESTWLFHEIGRCYLEMGKFEEAKDNGEKSMAAAEEAQDNVWKLNASVLIAQAEVKLGSYESAQEAFERSLDMAKLQGDTAAENAIKKALEDVNAKIVNGLKGESETEQTEEAAPAEQSQEEPVPAAEDGKPTPSDAEAADEEYSEDEVEEEEVEEEEEQEDN